MIHTIEPNLPFVDTLAAGIVERVGGEPLALAGTLVLLPTRRACRSLREAFLRRSGGEPSLLPRMLPLGDLDEDELSFADLSLDADLPPAVSGLERQLLLTRLILGRGDVPSPDQAARLAVELGRLLDQVQTEQLSFEGLAKLVEGDLARHWQVTLDFLKILTVNWPAILAERGGMDAAERRNRVILAQANAWKANPPTGPVIAAGSTGSIPATAQLLKGIAELPLGHVVLPGLDRTMDDGSWEALGESHPQYGLKRLVDQMGVTRASVPDWAATSFDTPASRAAQDEVINRPHPEQRSVSKPHPEQRSVSKDVAHPDRVRLIFEAMRPAETTEAWRELGTLDPRALEHVQYLPCPGPKEEALAIALIMRETLETPGKTAALVTPDRDLARRVAGELERWDVSIDDSAGRPLSNTPPGVFLRLTARLVAEDFAPVELLACFKHPLAAGGLAPVAFRDRTRKLETEVLRGPRPAPGLGSLRPGDPWLEGLEKIAAPFAALLAKDEAHLADLLRAHVDFTEALAASNEETGAERLWHGDDGEGAATFVAELHESAAILAPIDPRTYPALLEALLGGKVARPRWGRHPRLAILGPLEARLQQHDVLILGGLNEGTWPPEGAADPWMSRPMRRTFGLPLPERRIGLAAHDFAQGFCAPEVVLTRSRRVEGTPTVPSRWLLRLETVMTACGLEMDEGRTWLEWAALLDKADKVTPGKPPEPRPPLQARPNKMSVTQVETWMRDPYAIYARHILGLEVLDPIDADPGAADYGSMVHDALDEFVTAYPEGLPEDAEAQLLAIGRKHFEQVMALPGVWAFWWPRFERIAAWFLETERNRRNGIAQSHTEIWGELDMGGFTLFAKADRIDRMKDGTLSIIDYKTGAPPSKKEVAAGFAPQLPLEALIARKGGFKGVAKASVSNLLYWRLRGDQQGGEESTAGDDPTDLADKAEEGLKNLIAAFADEKTPYAARPHPEMARTYSDYLHLARVKEWASGGEEGE